MIDVAGSSVATVELDPTANTDSLTNYLRRRGCTVHTTSDGQIRAFVTYSETVETGQVDASAADLDEEEHVQPSQRDRLNGEEVDCEHARCLCAQERTPGKTASRAGRTEARLTKDLLHGRGRHRDAEAVQLTADPLVTPARILARKA